MYFLSFNFSSVILRRSMVHCLGISYHLDFVMFVVTRTKYSSLFLEVLHLIKKLVLSQSILK
jgi:hypothetical protein